jgi:hypothetical protein
MQHHQITYGSTGAKWTSRITMRAITQWIDGRQQRQSKRLSSWETEVQSLNELRSRESEREQPLRNYSEEEVSVMCWISSGLQTWRIPRIHWISRLQQRTRERRGAGKYEWHGPLGRPAGVYGWIIFKWILKKQDKGCGLDSSGFSGGLFWTRQRTFGFYEMVEISWVAVRMVASLQGFSSMDLVSLLVS